jgi:CheY-like chemotaxis protein
VLVAEDDLVNRKLMTRLLARLGCEVHAVANGIEVVAAARERAFDVILMDIEMPELDGYGATLEIRTLEEGTGRRTPIVALTAHALAETRTRCTEVGMDDYLAKPIGVTELVAALERWCARPATVAA